MQAATQSELPGTAAVRSRKDKAGQQIVFRLTELKSRLANLLTLHKKAQLAKEAEQDAVKAAAEASGSYASEVAAYVKAASGDTEKYEAAKMKAQQRALIFEELETSKGEIKQ